VFTALYALSPYIKQIRFVFEGLISNTKNSLLVRTAIEPSLLVPAHFRWCVRWVYRAWHRNVLVRHVGSFLMHMKYFIYIFCYMYLLPCRYRFIPPLLNTHSSTYHRHCIMFFSQYVFPCQYHSINDPYSFIY
jgi:hypothetical protein